MKTANDRIAEELKQLNRNIEKLMVIIKDIKNVKEEINGEKKEQE